MLEAFFFFKADFIVIFQPMEGGGGVHPAAPPTPPSADPANLTMAPP